MSNTLYLNKDGYRWRTLEDNGKWETITFYICLKEKTHTTRVIKYWEAAGSFAYPVVRYNNKDVVLMELMPFRIEDEIIWAINNEDNRSIKYKYKYP
jgi:hypothetical protein